jgi:DNA-binding transcriptional regulator YdaS (Cro superfamily)
MPYWLGQQIRQEHSDTRLRAQAMLAIGRDRATRGRVTRSALLPEELAELQTRG